MKTDRSRLIYVMLMLVFIAGASTAASPPITSPYDFLDEYTKAMDARDQMRAQNLVDENPYVAQLAVYSAWEQGRKFTREMRLDDAVTFLNIAMNIFEQKRAAIPEAVVRNDLAVVYCFKGQLHEALAAARDARRVLDAAGHEAGQKATRDTISLVFETFRSEREREQFLREHLLYARNKNLMEEYKETMRDLERIE